MGVDALDDAECALVEGGAEKSRHRGIPLILRRYRERGETLPAVVQKSRIDKVELHKLLALADLDAGAALPQAAEKIDVANVEKAAQAEIGRGTATVGQETRRLLFDRDDQVRQAAAVGSIACRLRFDINTRECIRAVQILLARIYIGRA